MQFLYFLVFHHIRAVREIVQKSRVLDSKADKTAVENRMCITRDFKVCLTNSVISRAVLECLRVPFGASLCNFEQKFMEKK